MMARTTMLYGVMVVVAVALSAPVFAQSRDGAHGPPHQHAATTSQGDQWEGSAEEKAYSEFNHHLAGVFVLLIGLSELRTALGAAMLAWTRFLLPVAMVGAGSFLIIWSDHDAWPIGSQSFLQSFVTGDFETVQHKLYGILLLGVGTIEMLRRVGRIEQTAWGIPLPAFAILGGAMLFLHSHGAHPAAHTIAMHHAVMGTMAIAAGSCKLVRVGSQAVGVRSGWELTWAGLILLIAVELLIYAE